MWRRAWLGLVLAIAALACSSQRPPPSEGAPLPAPPGPGPGAGVTDTYPNGPVGPYGTQAGDTLPNLAFVGRAKLAAPYDLATSYEWKPTSFDDLHKSGKGFALVFFPAAWCGPCEANSHTLGNYVSSFEDKGGLVVQVLVDGAAPDVYPTQQAIDSWIQLTSASYTTLADPEDKGPRSKGLFGWDTAIVIELQTMKLLYRGNPGGAMAEMKRRIGL